MEGGAIPKVYTDEEILALMSVTTKTIPNLRRISALHAFEISILNTWSIHNMLDGVRDVFNDAAGILNGVIVGGVLYNRNIFSVVCSSVEGASSCNNLIDDVISNTWSTASGVYAANVVFTGETDSQINGYIVRAGSTAGRYPIDWVLYGSNSGAFSGEEVVVDTVTGAVFAINEEITYICDTPNMYKYYKWDITASAGNTYLQVTELTFDIEPLSIISASTVAESQPTNIHAVILADDAAITLNTDLKFYASVDNGATWEQIILSDSGDYSATERILTGSVAVAGTGTTIKYKIECTDATFEFKAVGLLWD